MDDPEAVMDYIAVLRAESDRLEREAVAAALESEGGIEARAARRAGLTRNQLRAVLRRVPELAALATALRGAHGYRTGNPDTRVKVVHVPPSRG